MQDNTGHDHSSVSAPLLCCICQDQNTTFRYELVYKQANKSVTILDITDAANKEELELLTGDSPGAAVTSVTSENSDSAEYYNFPLKHPRHGHLKWPLLTPVTHNQSSEASYPDYPIHIPTFTLQRINNLLASKARRGNIPQQQPSSYY